MSVIEDRVQLKAGQYASLFISERPLDPIGYGEAMGEVMAEAENMRGYLGFESLRSGHDGIFISYWEDLDAVNDWAAHMGHKQAKSRGINEWYDAYRMVLCKVERTRWFRRAVSPQSR